MWAGPLWRARRCSGF